MRRFESCQALHVRTLLTTTSCFLPKVNLLLSFTHKYVYEYDRTKCLHTNREHLMWKKQSWDIVLKMNVISCRMKLALGSVRIVLGQRVKEVREDLVMCQGSDALITYQGIRIQVLLTRTQGIVLLRGEDSVLNELVFSIENKNTLIIPITYECEKLSVRGVLVLKRKQLPDRDSLVS